MPGSTLQIKGTEALKHKIRVIINKCRKVLILSGGVRISQASQDRLFVQVKVMGN